MLHLADDVGAALCAFPAEYSWSALQWVAKKRQSRQLRTHFTDLWTKKTSSPPDRNASLTEADAGYVPNDLIVDEGGDAEDDEGLHFAVTLDDHDGVGWDLNDGEGDDDYDC